VGRVMCDRCAELEERVAWLESELGLRRETEAEDRLHRFMTSEAAYTINRPGACRFTLALYRARGRAVSRPQVLEAVPPVAGGEDERNWRIVDVWACHARRALGVDAIQTVRSRGYRLTEAGMARVAAILGDQPRAAA
jgi:DNA-binding response OmpR family regulator